MDVLGVLHMREDTIVHRISINRIGCPRTIGDLTVALVMSCSNLGVSILQYSDFFPQQQVSARPLSSLVGYGLGLGLVLGGEVKVIVRVSTLLGSDDGQGKLSVVVRVRARSVLWLEL